MKLHNIKIVVAVLLLFTSRSHGQAPSNDNCTGAQMLSINTSCSFIYGSLINSTSSTVPAPTGYSSLADVWYKVFATDNIATLKTTHLAISSGLCIAIYSGGCGSLVLSNSGTDSLPVSGLTIGNPYYIRIMRVSGSVGANDTFGICITGNTYNNACWRNLGRGWLHTSAIKLDGTLWCWGRNNFGQLGDSTTIDQHQPTKIGNASNWKSITSGGYFTLAIKTDGSLWAWGENTYGQLGDGTNTNKLFPIRVGTGNNWDDVTAGHDFVLATQKDGTLWGWGINNAGQLGDSTTINKNVPVQIGTGNTWKRIIVGHDHSLATKTNGTLWAWGNNSYGELGDGTNTAKNWPVQIGSSSNWDYISAGWHYSTAVKLDGTLWSWGLNWNGRLGDSTTTDRNNPVQIGTSNNWKMVMARDAHTLAIKKDGSLWAWGNNPNGRLGDGTTTERHQPTLIGSSGWKEAFAFGSQSAAIKDDGSLWAWGYNGEGNVGDGTTTDRYLPTQITAGCTQPEMFPAITLSTASINTSQRDTINGSNFTPYKEAEINISSQNGDSIFRMYASANNLGNFSATWAPQASLSTGIYIVTATDTARHYITNPEQYVFVNGTQKPLQPTIQITSPDALIHSVLGNQVLITWTDICNAAPTTILNSAMVPVSYSIEDSTSSGWQLVANDLEAGELGQPGSYQYVWTPFLSGFHQLRITEVGDPLNSARSEAFEIKTDNSSYITVTKEWDASASAVDAKIQRIAADGIARFYFKISKKPGNARTIHDATIMLSHNDNLGTPTASTLGKLRPAPKADPNTYTMEANDAANISVTANELTGDSLFVWYVAPEDFNRGIKEDEFAASRLVKAYIEVTFTDNSKEILSETIEIVRPPLMFVHGLGGDGTAWFNTSYGYFGVRQRFMVDGEKIFVSGIRVNNMYKERPFLMNAKMLVGLDPLYDGSAANNIALYPWLNSFQSIIMSARGRGIVCNQVDYICHSMGGAVLRTAINKFPADYNPDINAKVILKNYGSGFVHKAITINTPHNGSPLADLAGSISSLVNSQAPMWARASLSALYDDGAQYSSYFERKAGWIPFVERFKVTPAVSDLQYKNDGSLGLGGVRFKETMVRNHLIAGQVAGGTTGGIGFMNTALMSKDWIKYLLYFVDIANGRRLGFHAAAGSAVAYVAINNVFALYGLNNFIDQSDLVVPISSQLPGVSLSNRPNHATLFLGSKYWHIPMPDQDSVGDKIMELLNKPLYSDYFAPTIPANPLPGNNLYKVTGTLDSTIEYVDTQKGQISWISSMNPTVDSIIKIKLHLKDTSNYVRTVVTFQGATYESSRKADTLIFELKVNSYAIDSQIILVGFQYDSVGFKIYHYDYRIPVINTDNTLSRIALQQRSIMVNPQERFQPAIKGIHDRYLTSIALRNNELTYSISDPSVATYVDSLRQFTAKDSGSTRIVFDYHGRKDTLMVYITKRSPYRNIPMAVPTLSFPNSSVKVYPNPSPDLVTIEGSKLDENILLTDVNGKIIRILRARGSSKTIFSIKSLSSGIYLLSGRETNRVSWSRKLIKQ
jgi:alpha-tubulin suppressor-like RCC1 family protein/triacylglycerol esterase/lipase EstA (alpha/beta hydrolase family)